MQITDSLALDASGLTFTRDGFLTGNAKVSRAGNVQDYLGAELGLKGADAAKMFGVYRDPDTVFDEASMQSLAGRPVTRNHPPAGVEATTWKDLAVGHVGGRIVRDGEHVVASMAIMDAAAAQEVAKGARSLSAGYTVGLTKDSGTAPDGTPYQYRQTGPLRFNHVAYLPDNNPRAGNTKFGDDANEPEASPLPTNDENKEQSNMADNLTPVVLGDKEVVSVTSDAARIIETAFDGLKTKLSDATAAHDAAMATKDADLAKKDGQIAELEAKVLDAAAIDKMVADRATLIDTAKRLSKDVKTDGLSDADIRKAVVTAVRGADAIADKPEAYIDAAFDFLADAKPEDKLRKGIADMKTQAIADNGQSAYETRISGAWKGEAK